MRIAIVGTRGIPAAYGGFETMAWELSTRLADRGHQIVVYCRAGRTDEATLVPHGIERHFLPFVGGKYLETVSHTAISILDCLVHPYDAILVVNAANAVFAGLPRLRGSCVVLNVDGIERRRSKWGSLGRAWYAVGERLALHFPNAIVTDARVIKDYYATRYGKRTELIAYGAPLLSRHPEPDLGQYGLNEVRPGEFILYVSRLEPENQADMVISAYRTVPGNIPLLIVGDAPHADAFKRRLQLLASADDRVRLVGSIYGAGYQDLQRSAMAYIQATSVGGTHPALIEAMGAGNVVIAYASPENVEVTRDSALLFENIDELAQQLTLVVTDPHSESLRNLSERARAVVREHYSWDAVVDQYESLWERLLAARSDSRP